MKIIPKKSDFAHWADLVPSDGDLVFLTEQDRKLFSKIPVPILTEIEARNQGLWSLNNRSWYGYALNNAPYCAWFPKGMIECLETNTQKALADSQSKIGVPTLMASRLIPKRISKKFLKFGQNHWITSYIWNYLTKAEQVAVVRAWFVQNDIHAYSSFSFDELAPKAKALLKSIGYQTLLNRYVKVSGPNCLAAAAGAVAHSMHVEIALQWMHPEPFDRFIKERSYRKVKDAPLAGDIFVFSKKEQIVHASYYLGDGVYFEKSGQDFYEPYRIEYFKNWKREWPNAKLSIFRLSQ